MFYDWRRLSNGAVDPDFPLNDAKYNGASILVTGKNFGCGSSREHAPWALADFGFRSIIAPSFADIFANNCLKNGLLPVELKDSEVATIFQRARQFENYKLTVDLEQRVVTDAGDFSARFAIDDFQRDSLMAGLDEVGLTLQYEADIEAFERQRPGWIR